MEGLAAPERSEELRNKGMGGLEGPEAESCRAQAKKSFTVRVTGLRCRV